MSTTVLYNTVLLEQVRIMEYRVESPANFESPHTGILQHFVTGEALVFVDNDFSPQAFRSLVINKLNVPRKQMKIEVEDSNQSPTTKYTLFDNTVYTENFDEAHGPFFSAQVTAITGTRCLLVNFTAQWTESGDSLNAIRSYYCVSSFSIDEIGNVTLRKTGSLQIRAKENFTPPMGVAPRNQDRAGVSNTGVYFGDSVRSDVVTDFITSNISGNVGQFPDCYRRFAAGNLYPGFRRIRQEYAIDESRTRLIFDITDQEFTRGLPAPAKVGNCSFTYERSLDGKTSAIGTKHFIASVKGDKFVTAGALLTLCIRLSQNRIDYAKDVIQRIRVTEENMLTENSISYEVLALSASSQAFVATSGDNTEDRSGQVSPVDTSLLLKNILSPVKLSGGKFVFTPAKMPDAYGNSLIVRVTPYAFDHHDTQSLSSASFSLPSTFQIPNDEGSGLQPVIYLFPGGYFDASEGQANDTTGNEDAIYRYIPPKTEPYVPAGPNKGDLEKNKRNPNSSETPNPNFSSKGGRKINVRSGIVICPPVSPSAKSRVFQVAAPMAVYTDFIDGSKKNEPPNRSIGDVPGGSVVTDMNYSFTSGTSDLNGNRIMAAGYDRTVAISCPGDFPGTGESPTQPAFELQDRTYQGETYRIVTFNPKSILMPSDETQGQNQPAYTDGLGSPEGYLA
jgi:hypothetical protein